MILIYFETLQPKSTIHFYSFCWIQHQHRKNLVQHKLLCVKTQILSCQIKWFKTIIPEFLVKKTTYLHTWALSFEPLSFSTDLMTPTATVCFRSLAAKRPGKQELNVKVKLVRLSFFGPRWIVVIPKGGYVKKLSTHIGLMGTSLTVAASPDISTCGRSSSFFPVRRSSFSLSSAKRQVTWAVWQSRTGE